MCRVYRRPKRNQPNTGGAVGDEFRVNTYTSNSQYDPSITSLADGGFIVAWESSGQDGDGYGIYAQRFDASGAPASTVSYVGTDGDDTETISGGENLLIDLGDGNDTVTLGAGDDTVTVRDTETVNMGDGDDTVTVDGQWSRCHLYDATR